ncbi:TPA: LemA family protein [Klebsiella oxytoca]|uniref:LemA family protein n=1 Tax=Klebsiella oxytoca TaxID=571 RepID=A0AAN5RES5_KLEOX|nr:LemA family protein [Klebsiella oxytoca]
MNLFLAILIIMLVLAGSTGQLISTYNQLVALKHNMNKSFANIDVLLRQRADELPELIKVVKASQAYEQQTLHQLTELRTAFLNCVNREEKVTLTNQMNGAIKSLFAVAENYPELQVSRAFIELQKRISLLEDQIADRREFFNESVTLYNVGINEFPALILARLLNYRVQSLLQIQSEETHYDGVTL